MHDYCNPLPKPNKKVIYLDQFVISKMLARPEEFWRELYATISRLVLTQQAVFPTSLTHLEESATYHKCKDIEKILESISGGITFDDEYEIQRQQIRILAKAFITEEVAAPLAFNVDSVLIGNRNSWIAPIRIIPNFTWSNLADGIIKTRDTVSKRFNQQFANWQSTKPTFKMVLENELKNAQLLYQNPSYCYALPINCDLRMIFQSNGVPEEECNAKIEEFWQWEEVQALPKNYIQAHLLAALAFEAHIWKKPPTRGMWNDINFISTYLPYCDAMFIDNGCAELIKKSKLSIQSAYSNTLIFSTNTAKQFLDYLKKIEHETDPSFITRLTTVGFFNCIWKA